MNIFAIIFWFSFIALFMGHMMLLRIEEKKLNVFEYVSLLLLNITIYLIIDYSATNWLPPLVGNYGSQTIIGSSAGWFIAKLIKNNFRINQPFLWSTITLIAWYNYVF